MVIANVQPSSKKRDGDCILQPSSKKQAMIDSSAERPDDYLSSTNVAFIACPDDMQDFEINRNCDRFIRGVRIAVEAGAHIINICFSRTTSEDADDAKAKIFPKLQSMFDDEWTSGAVQPAYSYRHVESVVSFYLHSRVNLVSAETLDPEKGLPAIVLTFEGPEGSYCIITTSLPALPRTTKARLLQTYASAAANTKADIILISVVLADGVLFMENRFRATQPWIEQFELFNNANLCLLANCPYPASVHCIALDAMGPFSLISSVKRSDTSASDSQASAESVCRSTRAMPVYVDTSSDNETDDIEVSSDNESKHAAVSSESGATTIGPGGPKPPSEAPPPGLVAPGEVVANALLHHNSIVMVQNDREMTSSDKKTIVDYFLSANFSGPAQTSSLGSAPELFPCPPPCAPPARLRPQPSSASVASAATNSTRMQLQAMRGLLQQRMLHLQRHTGQECSSKPSSDAVDEGLGQAKPEDPPKPYAMARPAWSY